VRAVGSRRCCRGISPPTSRDLTSVLPAAAAADRPAGTVAATPDSVAKSCVSTGFISSRNAPERRSGPFRHIAAKFRFHLNESDKFAHFGSKMPSASRGLSPPDPMTRGCAPGPRGRHILSVPVLFLAGNEPCVSNALK